MPSCCFPIRRSSRPTARCKRTRLPTREAYYAAIDPTNAKDTLAKWKAANGFDTGTGTQVTAVFGDSRDLGYGRRMTARQNPDGTLAFFVENYLVRTGAGYDFSPLNLEAAIVRDPKSLLYINAIEFSPGPAGGSSFAKFFNFNVVTGRRETTANIDGRGDKVMPGPCITCHGGRGDALTPPDASGKRRFNLAAERGVADARRRAGAAAAVRGRRLRFLHDAGIHAGRAGGRAQGHQQDDPVFVPAARAVDVPRGRLPAPGGPERVAGLRRRARSRRSTAATACRTRRSRTPTCRRRGWRPGRRRSTGRWSRPRAACATCCAARARSRTSTSRPSRNSGLRRSHARARRRSRQHAAREDRRRRVLRLERAARRWRPSSGPGLGRPRRRRQRRCGLAGRSPIPGPIA